MQTTEADALLMKLVVAVRVGEMFKFKSMTTASALGTDSLLTQMGYASEI